MDVHPPNAAASSLVDLFPHEPTLEGGEDSSLEWLSFYVEDCLSSSTSYTNLVTPEPTPTTIRDQTTTKPKTPPPSSNVRKKKRGLATVMCRNDEQHYVSWFLDPPLFNQTEWLAESELIIPKKDKDQALGQQQELGQVEEENKKSATLRRCSHCLSHLTPQWRNGPLEPRTLCDACDLRSKCSNELIFCNKDEDQEIDEEQEQAQEKKSKKCASVGGEPVKRCTHCMSYKTPQWRAGPLGPKTLCNACGVRFKSGRLLPEYRPANSPTFVSYKHSNSHKKVLQLRGYAVPSTRRAN